MSPVRTPGRIVYVNSIVFSTGVTRPHPELDRLRLQRCVKYRCHPYPPHAGSSTFTEVYSIVFDTEIASAHHVPDRLRLQHRVEY